MTHAVARGKPYASQLYLDKILDEVLQSGITGVKRREEVSLPQILFHCLKKNPDDIFMINAATGEKITNAQIFKKAVSLARALVSKGVKGKKVIILMRNHETMASVYFAILFAGAVPSITDPNTTVFEIKHFLKLIEPCKVFCDEEHYNDVKSALKDVPIETEVKVSNKDELLSEMAAGYSEEADGFHIHYGHIDKDHIEIELGKVFLFKIHGTNGSDLADCIQTIRIPDIDLEATVMMLPTSGSTGLPKATLMTHRGLVMQLPIVWCYQSQFPTPTELCMLLTTPQWVTFTMYVTSCLVYRVPLLMSQKKPTVDWVKEMLVTYRPSSTFFGPAFVKSLLPTLTEDHLSSLKSLQVLGAPSSLDMITALKAKLPSSASLGDLYGTTEAQGYITTIVPGAPLNCTGQVVNIFDYKLVDDNGKTVGLGENGELYVKGPTIIKGYYKSQNDYDESFSDGWLKTGDLFHIDESERLFYLERKKFCFKFMGSHVSPEEVELVIGSVPGVEECAVCATDDGPAALVVAQGVSREQIFNAVKETLSEHKQLHGGIAFVPSLPHTHSGKLKRTDCKPLIQDLLKAGKCY